MLSFTKEVQESSIASGACIHPQDLWKALEGEPTSVDGRSGKLNPASTSLLLLQTGFSTSLEIGHPHHKQTSAPSTSSNYEMIVSGDAEIIPPKGLIEYGSPRLTFKRKLLSEKTIATIHNFPKKKLRALYGHEPRFESSNGISVPKQSKVDIMFLPGLTDEIIPIRPRHTTPECDDDFLYCQYDFEGISDMF
jgi:hypothetical protein